jgi:molybdopterin-binding protein
MTRMITTIVTAAALALPLAAAPATAQQSQKGLVNVQIGDIETGDILSDITVNVGVGLNIAANVCGVSVGVLATQLGQQGVAHCQTDDQSVDLTSLGSIF